MANDFETRRKSAEDGLKKLKAIELRYYGQRGPVAPTGHDIFISNASEDKDFVRPLAEALRDRGLDVWYDDYALKVGDSLRGSIDKGLSNCRYGVVILSTDFFKKNWTRYELNGLVMREMEGKKVVLPIWHKVTKNDVLKFSPSLADKVALNSSIMSVDEIAKQLVSAIKEPDRE